MDGHETKMKAKLGEGRALMADGEYASALSSVMKAISMCPCTPTSHGKDKSCNILQCIRALRDPDPESLWRMVAGPCSCGFVWPSCTNPLHLEAVDILANCLEKTKHYAAAFSTALGLVRLDPASAIGYCRVARIMRYLVKHCRSSDTHVVRSISVILRDAKLASIEQFRDTVYSFVKSGLYNTEKYRHGPDTKHNFILRQMSHNMNMVESRKDPLRKLPREIISMIFSYLDATALIRSCRVDRMWRQVLGSDKVLWSSIRLRHPRSTRYFAKFLQRHHEIKSLAIDDVSAFQLTPDKLCSILALPNLEHLCLGIRSGFIHPGPSTTLASRLRNPFKLVRLSLMGLSESRNIQVLQHLVEKVSESLETLNIDNQILFNSMLGISVLTQLKKLRFTSTDRHRPNINISRLSKVAYNLEYLYLDGCYLNCDAPSNPNSPCPLERQPWQCFRSLTLGSECRQNLDCRTFPYLPKTLQVLELMTSDRRLVQHLLSMEEINATSTHPEGDDGGSPSELLHWPNLETFRCRAALDIDLLKRTIEPAVKSGVLKVLEFTPPSTHSIFSGTLDDSLLESARDYAFASSEHIHTVGMYSFNFGSDFSGFDGQPFIDWLDSCFPNVSTVTAYPGAFPNVGPFLMKLICRPGIRTVHQDRLHGVEWDEAQELARKHGVQLFHTPGNTPIGWPFID
ncbi:hypothetical protein B0H66DRAFT_114780 [Apodospora peruviana]|uniref:F-box domain-containing protein n=1 Tax=Apodospora peruviana TaxID=516989 RepID=A0AAE0IHJ5_9PEZI|nr:hypothetical protein B0H66DRAFT_114780 [Apodospora peruviana]